MKNTFAISNIVCKLYRDESIQAAIPLKLKPSITLLVLKISKDQYKDWKDSSAVGCLLCMQTDGG